MKTDSPDSIPCFECDEGILLPELRTYHTTLPEYGEVAIPDIPMLCCSKCGDLVTDKAGDDAIQEAITRILNPITPEEVHYFLQKYNITQKEASQITGYGEKNISRWLTGKVRPTTSVSNFLRILSADEGAFQKLRTKNFKTAPKATFPAKECQPDDEEKEIMRMVDYPRLAGFKGGRQAQKTKE